MSGVSPSVPTATAADSLKDYIYDDYRKGSKDALLALRALVAQLAAAETARDLYELTLHCIKANAESWHGQGEEGPRRAHNVIAAWATNALDHGQLPPIAEDIAARVLAGGDTT